MPPLEVESRLVSKYPAAAYDTRKVVDFYLRESFAGETLDAHALAELRTRLHQARRKFRRSA